MSTWLSEKLNVALAEASKLKYALTKCSWGAQSMMVGMPWEVVIIQLQKNIDPTQNLCLWWVYDEGINQWTNEWMIRIISDLSKESEYLWIGKSCTARVICQLFQISGFICCSQLINIIGFLNSGSWNILWQVTCRRWCVTPPSLICGEGYIGAPDSYKVTFSLAG